MAEINITPFVDVMLVLLIIFMVAAPLMTVGVPVDLPKTAASALPSDEEEPLTVTIKADGSLAIQTTDTAEDELITEAAGDRGGTHQRPHLPARGRHQRLEPGGRGDGRTERRRVHQHRPCHRHRRHDAAGSGVAASDPTGSGN